MTYLHDKCTPFLGDDALYPLNPDNIVILYSSRPLVFRRREQHRIRRL